MPLDLFIIFCILSFLIALEMTSVYTKEKVDLTLVVVVLILLVESTIHLCRKILGIKGEKK